MKARSLIAAALLAVLPPSIGALADSAPAPRETVAPQFRHEIPNIPGKSLVAVVVNYAPGATSAAHRHAPSAVVYAYVLSGAIRSQVDDKPARIYRAGESWFEAPGAHHRISGNASDSEPASLLAVFVVDSSQAPLTIPDQP
jgi:quercetin dioxygenase-like cupin family protein